MIDNSTLILPKTDMSKLPDFKQRFYKKFGCGINFAPITNSVRLLEFIENELQKAEQRGYERGKKLNEVK